MAIDLDRLGRLVDAAEAAGLGEIEVSRPGYRARIVRAAAPTAPARPAAPAPAGAASAPRIDEGWRLVTAPKVGIFRIGRDRRTGQPLGPGDEVRPGESLGTVLVMKVPYEIVADRPGWIAEILVEDGAGVEFGQPLMYLSEE